ncbi:hypothetical protein [Aeoliella mucimassa]|uniref:ArnR1-like winged helix-turn-helix domain-containing protein n=1 Tax=Aeoliella mucimassa TaxID=2527972 RepID=A0A518ATU8_9BACT|nr:hypothetical protein [Aeoliella mucimassa]QDU58152.1 hypothetical protein Pan181_43790 [Aeoliella mucimassa]
MTEECVLTVFRQFYMTPDKMLCFYGQDLEDKTMALQSLVDRQFLVREKFKGGYSLTEAGYHHMKQSV